MTITVVAVHGNGGGAFRWEKLPQPLDAGVPEESGVDATEQVELLAMTLPGFAGTPLPPDASMATFTAAVTDAARAIEGKVVLLGTGIGGSIALDAVARDSALADGLILHAPVGANLDKRWFPRVMSNTSIRRSAKWLIGSWAARQVGKRLLFDDPDYADRFLHEYRRADGFELFFDLLTAEWFESVPHTEIASAVLWGENDRVLSASQATGVEERLDDPIRRVVPDWGHYPMIEQPASYAAVVSELARTLVA